MSGPLALPAEAFWADDAADGALRRRTQAAVLERADDGFEGLLLEAPDVVDLARRDDLPLFGWHVRRLRDDPFLDLERDGLLVAVDLETDAVRSGPAFPSADSRIPETPPPPAADPGEGLTLTTFSGDARAALGLPDRPARYRLHLLLRDRRSNGATTARVDPAPGEAGDAPDPGGPAPPWPERAEGADLPAWEADAETPDLPGDGPGIALTADRVTVLRPGARRLLRARFRLPVRPRHRAPEGAGPPAAVVPLTLVVTGSRGRGPWVLPVRVPFASPPGDLAEGALRLDLLATPGFPRAAQTCFVSAFAGEVAAGPAPAALVAERELRP